MSVDLTGVDLATTITALVALFGTVWTILKLGDRQKYVTAIGIAIDTFVDVGYALNLMQEALKDGKVDDKEIQTISEIGNEIQTQMRAIKELLGIGM